MKTNDQTTEPTPSPGATCWADLSTAKRNNLIGKLINGNVILRPYMARDGKYLWYCPITADEAVERGKWLAEQQATEKSWDRFLEDFDKRIMPEDRGKITIQIEEQHLRYSDTPGGGWMVIEWLRGQGWEHAASVSVASVKDGWQVTFDDGNPHHGRRIVISETMEDAACQVALLISPNV
jgi:hypothetical protein